MVGEPQDLVVRLLREIQATQAVHGRDLASIKDELRRQTHKVDELFESSTMALGLAGHANVRHDALLKRIDELAQRVERLESKA